MATQQALYGLFLSLIDFLLSSAAGFFFAPLLTLFFLLRFLRWPASYRGGSDLDDMREQYSEYRQRAEQAPSRFRDSSRKRY